MRGMDAKNIPILGGLIEIEPANSKAFQDKETGQRVVYPKQDQVTVSLGRKTYTLPAELVKILLENKEVKSALDLKGGLF